MKTSREEILSESLRLFSERGFDAVSTSMIAEKLGITKGALYRHFESKQAIFDGIISRMYELDSRQAEGSGVPTDVYSADEESYKKTAFPDLCGFVNEQFVFWTENEFACLFRRMMTIEQYKNPTMRKLYQDIAGLGPVQYTADLLHEMLENGQLKASASSIGAFNLAMQLFAPLQLSLHLFDGGSNPDEIKAHLKSITKDFEDRWMKSGE